jgi:glycosyltransferase involved in cell wall biosynthesis
MKVLQINCVYNKGSTGKIMTEIHEGLVARGFESVICFGRGEKVNKDNVYKTCGELYSKFNNLWSRISGLKYGGCFFSTKRLINIIKREKPNVVHLQCINGNFVNIYKLITWLKKSGVKTVLTLHAEFMHTANCSHAFECEEWKTGCKNCKRWRQETNSWFFNRTRQSWKKMRKAFDGFNNLTVISVSPWLMERAKQSPILSDKTHVVILNGLDTEVFKIYDTTEKRKELGLEKSKIVLHVTPYFAHSLDNNKGGHFVVDVAKNLEKENVNILIAGEYEQGIEVPENVILLGRVSDQKELAKYYGMADVTLLTSKRETFSMVTAESLSCGTPVVGFKAGAPEQIAIKEYSEFVEYGDVESLTEKVKAYLSKEFDKKEISRLAHEKYADEKMIEETIKIYNE